MQRMSLLQTGVLHHLTEVFLMRLLSLDIWLHLLGTIHSKPLDLLSCIQEAALHMDCPHL